MTVGFLTDGRAKKWGLSRARWEERVLRACLIDPEELARSGARLSKAFSRGQRVRITHSNGTDLELALNGSPPLVHDGRPHPKDKRFGPFGMLEQIPAGRVEVGLDPTIAEGSFHANRRTNIWWHVHAGGKLEFADGRLTSYSLDEGAEDFDRQYRSRVAGKDHVGRITLGLNPAATDIPNLEQIERGCVSLTVEDGTNFFSWFSLAGSEIAVDGTPVLRAGKLL